MCGPQPSSRRVGNEMGVRAYRIPSQAPAPRLVRKWSGHFCLRGYAILGKCRKRHQHIAARSPARDNARRLFASRFRRHHSSLQRHTQKMPRLQNSRRGHAIGNQPDALHLKLESIGVVRDMDIPLRGRAVWPLAEAASVIRARCRRVKIVDRAPGRIRLAGIMDFSTASLHLLAANTNSARGISRP